VVPGEPCYRIAEKTTFTGHLPVVPRSRHFQPPRRQYRVPAHRDRQGLLANDARVPRGYVPDEDMPILFFDRRRRSVGRAGLPRPYRSPRTPSASHSPLGLSITVTHCPTKQQGRNRRPLFDVGLRPPVSGLSRAQVDTGIQSTGAGEEAGAAGRGVTAAPSMPCQAAEPQREARW